MEALLVLVLVLLALLALGGFQEGRRAALPPTLWLPPLAARRL